MTPAERRNAVTTDERKRGELEAFLEREMNKLEDEHNGDICRKSVIEALRRTWDRAVHTAAQEAQDCMTAKEAADKIWSTKLSKEKEPRI